MNRLVHDRSDVAKGTGSIQQFRIITKGLTLAFPVAYDSAGALTTSCNRDQRDRMPFQLARQECSRYVTVSYVSGTEPLPDISL